MSGLRNRNNDLTVVALKAGHVDQWADLSRGYKRTVEIGYDVVEHKFYVRRMRDVSAAGPTSMVELSYETFDDVDKARIRFKGFVRIMRTKH